MARNRADMAVGTKRLMPTFLNYYWRLCATGACFAIFSLGGFVLWAAVFPLLAIIPGHRRSGRARWIIYKSFGAFLWLMQAIGIMRMEVEGSEKLRCCEGALVLANHPTLIDVVALLSLMPSASCVVKHALWMNPFLGGVVRAAGYISNFDSDRLIDDCANDLKSGKPLIIFPEGTRTEPGERLGFQRGAAYIALRSGVPVIPVLIDCNPSTLTKCQKWYQIPSCSFHLRIRVLDPVVADQWVDSGETQTIKARKLTRAFEGFFVTELSKWTC